MLLRYKKVQTSKQHREKWIQILCNWRWARSVNYNYNGKSSPCNSAEVVFLDCNCLDEISVDRSEPEKNLIQSKLFGY